MPKLTCYDPLRQKFRTNLSAYTQDFLTFSYVSSGISLNGVLEHVFHLEFVACALSTPITHLVEAGLDCPVHLPCSLQEWGPCDYQSSTSFLTALFSFLTLLPERGPCMALSVLVGSPSLPTHVSICCIELYCANLIYRHEVEGKSWWGERFDLQVGFFILERKNTVELCNIQIRKAKSSPGDSLSSYI